MSTSKKTVEFKFERQIAAAPHEVYDAWLNPRIPGNPWNAAEKVILDPKADGLFYWTLKATSHYGRFTEAERRSNSAYLDVTKYLGTRVDSYFDL